jgi:hypothetical protein
MIFEYSLKTLKELTPKDASEIFLIADETKERIKIWSKEEAFFNVLMIKYPAIASEITNRKQLSINYPISKGSKTEKVITDTMKNIKDIETNHHREDKLKKIL